MSKLENVQSLRAVAALLVVADHALPFIVGRGAGPDPENVYGRAAALRTSLIGIWETPSAALTRQYSELKVELPKAVAEANAVLTRAGTLSQTLKRSGIDFSPPSPPK